MMTLAGKTPKYRKMAELFREQIRSGRLRPGEKLPTDAELSVQFSLNNRTVANGMAQLVAEGLITRTPGRGSVVVRQVPVPRKNNSVGIFADTTTGRFHALDREVSLRSIRKGFYPMWAPNSVVGEATIQPGYKPMLNLLERFINDHPYGLIMHGERFMPFDLLERNRSKFENLVFIGDYLHNKDLPAKYVLIDYDIAAEKAVRCLAENGHRKFMFLSTSQHHYPFREENPTPQLVYWNAIKKACRKYEMEYDESIPEALWGGISIESVIREKILGKGYTAAICAFDSVWARCYSPAFSKAGLRMPEDLSVIGFFNTPEGEFFETPITSIDVNEAKMSQLATDMLFSEDPMKVEKRYITPKLVIRESVNRI